MVITNCSCHGQCTSSLTKSEAFWSKLLSIACFAVDFTILISHCGGIELLPTGTAFKACLVPRTSSSHYLLGHVHRLPTSRARVWSLGNSGRSRNRGRGEEGLGTSVNTLSSTTCHSQCSCPLTISNSFWAKVLPIASFAVDLSLVICDSGGVQLFPAVSAAEAFLVPHRTSPYYLLSHVHSIATAGTVIASSSLPAFHLGEHGGAHAVASLSAEQTGMAGNTVQLLLMRGH